MLKLEVRPQPSKWMSLASPLLALALTVVLGLGLFVLLGKDPLRGLQMFFWEPIKSAYAWSELGIKATPLVLIALGLAVCFRSNVWNIGAEGQFIVGALAGGWVAMQATPETGRGIVVLILLAGVAGGAAWAAQCGNNAGGFEAWKQQMTAEARSRGIGQRGLSALQGTRYATATIRADRGQKSFKYSLKKFMQVPDACVRQYFELLTDLPLADVDRLLAGHPKEAKVTLAKTVIGQYHDAAAGEEAAVRWQREIGEGGVPADIPECPLQRDQLGADGAMPAAALLKALRLSPSTSEAMRLISGGGAYFFDGDEKVRITDRQQAIAVRDGMIVQAGKKKIGRVRLSQ